MSEADKTKNTEATKPVTTDTVQTAKQQQQQLQAPYIEDNINNLLQTASTFPVKYQPPAELLENSSGRMTLSIVRAKFEKTWDVKVISARLSEDNLRSVFWIISPRKALEPVKVRKPGIMDDDFDFDDLMSPLKFKP